MFANSNEIRIQKTKNRADGEIGADGSDDITTNFEHKWIVMPGSVLSNNT